jgi:hypothetical protein
MPKRKDEIVAHLDQMSTHASTAARGLNGGAMQCPPGVSPVEQEAARIQKNLETAAHDIDALTAKVRRCDIP